MRKRIAIINCTAALALAAVLWGAASSPVADAAMRGDRASVRALLAQKADVNAPQADGARALHWAVYKNDLELADLLISAGADVGAANRNGVTALALASLGGNAAMIERLVRAGADPNERNPNGETPLMLTSRNGSVEAMRVLLDRKADVNAKEKVRGTTALMWAVEQAHPSAVKLLVERGADVKAATNFDTKGNRAYVANTVSQRSQSAQGTGGLGQQGGGRGRGFLGGGGGAGTPGGGGRAGRGGAGAAGQPAGAPQAAAGDIPVDLAAIAAAAGVDVAELTAATGGNLDIVQVFDQVAAVASFGRTNDKDGGALTPLIFAARQNCMECARTLIEAGADVNQTSHYGWTPLLVATQNRHYKLGAYLLEKGANPSIQNKGGWSPLYLATDNRNIEGGDYPTHQPDMDHLEFIKLLLAKGASVNVRVCAETTPTECKGGDNTETRTNFTMQWLFEPGATPFLRAAQSSDTELMKLLLAHGADPKIPTSFGDTALSAAAGIGWTEGVTFEWSREQNLEAVKMLLDLGLDVNGTNREKRGALHGAAHKGRNEIVQLLVDRGADLEAHDIGSRDTVNGAMRGMTWIPLHYAQGLVRVGVQSAIAHPDTAELIKKLMRERGLTIPPDITSSICLTKGLNGCQ
jgi:ankyrin repeat protein